jgi:hypothetical protein
MSRGPDLHSRQSPVAIAQDGSNLGEKDRRQDYEQHRVILSPWGSKTWPEIPAKFLASELPNRCTSTYTCTWQRQKADADRHTEVLRAAMTYVSTYGHPHAMSSGRHLAVAGVVAVVVALAPPAVASADNSNNNTNNNDVTDVGNPSDGSARSNANTNWPPADLSWPPSDMMNSGGQTATPIVMPRAPT